MSESGSQVCLSSDIRRDTPSTEAQIVACPRCHERLLRVRRRPIDRIVSVFQTVHRFRCYNSTCQWEGTRSLRQLRRRSRKQIHESLVTQPT